MNKLVLISLLCGLSKVVAQTTPPVDPQVAPIPKMARWELVNPAAKPVSDTPGTVVSEGDEFRSASITRTGDERKVVINKVGGSTEIWLSKGETFINLRGIISSGPTDDFSPPYLRTGERFFGTEWVKAANFKGNAKYKGRDCRFYETEQIREIDRILAAQHKEVGMPQPIRYRAWIEVETLLPVAVEGPEGAFVYAFSPPPNAALILPTEFQEKRDRVQREVQKQQQEASVR